MPPMSASVSKQSNGMPRSAKVLATASPQAPAPIMQYRFTISPRNKMLLGSVRPSRLAVDSTEAGRLTVGIEAKANRLIDLHQIAPSLHRLSRHESSCIQTKSPASGRL